MPNAKTLSEVERAKIDVYSAQGFSSRKIAEKINRSKTVINNYLSDIENYGTRQKGRTSFATTERERRSILRTASNSSLSVKKIKAKTEVAASVTTVWRVITNSDHLVRRKFKQKPVLNAINKEKRLDFARTHMTWNNEWKVVFSDEKKFNLDGPDGYKYYWHDLRKEEIILARRHSRTGGIMVWGAITYYGTIDLEFRSVTMNGETYKTLLQNVFPSLHEKFGHQLFIFQQDNAPIHNAKVVKDWIRSENIELLPWPPYSPDLNIIENIWGLLSRKVYEGGRQFEMIPELVDAIKMAWSEMSQDCIQSLYNSLSNRIFEVINNNGGSTHY